MSTRSRLHKIGWLAALALCTLCYLALHLKVHAVQSEVVRAERRIVQLKDEKLLLETEFATRASQEQLASWNRVEFGYTAPEARQFIESERQLARFGAPRLPGAPEPIRVASLAGAEEAPPFPKFVSPLTGEPLDEELIQPEGHRVALDARSSGGALRIPLAAAVGTVGE